MHFLRTLCPRSSISTPAALYTRTTRDEERYWYICSSTWHGHDLCDWAERVLIWILLLIVARSSLDSAAGSALEQTHCARIVTVRFNVSDQRFLLFYFLIHWSGVLTELTWLVPYETAAVLTRSVYTGNHAKATHTYGACVFSCNLLSALLAEWPWPSFYVLRVRNEYRNKAQPHGK